MTSEAVDPVLTGVRNFRDVGGLPTTDGRRVRQGVLYRSGHLAHATAQDAAFLSELGLHTVFDFRNSADQALEGPDVELPGVRNVNIPLTDPAEGADFWKLVQEGDLSRLRTALADGQAAARMELSYRTMVTHRTSDHSKVLHSLAEGGVPALMHCAAGKDRAGLSIAVTLLALGVERDAIESDYLLSNDPRRRYRIHRGDPGKNTKIEPEIKELLSPLFDARTTYLDSAYTAINETWGDVESYLSSGLKVNESTRERLRDQLLE